MSAIIASASVIAITAAASAAELRRGAIASANPSAWADPAGFALQRLREGQLEPATVDRQHFAARLDARSGPVSAILKRAFDLAAALGVLALLAPVMALTAILIRLETPGPALYRQTRVGLDGRAFSILKFRSMVVDAEKNGAQWARKRDPRVTRVGRLIRKTRIDELPQAFNVLRGEMSFVGPRPERPEFVRELERAVPNYALRHAVKPGITGWAQVKYEYGASIEDAHEKLKYDLFYIRHQSFLFDCLIAVMTVRVALFGLGGR